MASVDFGRHETYRDRRRKDGRDYLALFCLIYPIALIAAAFGRLIVLMGAERLEGPRGSIFAEARTTAASIIPFALR